MCAFKQFSELALKWHTLSYIGCSECLTGATTVTELTELSSPGGESPCFDFGGAIIQFSISGSNYQSFLNPPSWAAQLTIITMRIKVIVICCIWNFFLKKTRTGIERSVLERFLSGGNWNVLQFRMRRRRDGRWGKMRKDGFLKMRKMEFSKWGRKMEDGIDFPLFQVIDKTGRMAASSRWEIQLHYFLILSLWLYYIPDPCPPFKVSSPYILTIKPPRYGVTLKQLRELMESRGYDGVQKVTHSYFLY